jgi:cytosine permease
LDGIGGAGTAKTLWGPDGAKSFSLLFAVVAIVWGYLFAFFGAKGIKYVAKMANIFPVVPIVMLIVGAIMAAKGIGKFGGVRLEHAEIGVPAAAGMLLAIQMVIGFGATALAAGADFCQSNRNATDVKVGGLAGIWGASLFAGILALLAVAGANGVKDLGGDFRYATALGSLGKWLPKAMMILFAVGSIAPACFCSFIIGNSLSTMIPSVPRTTWTFGGATVGILLAMTGVAGNLSGFFGLIGASFGPVCGAMAADFLLSGGKWPGPRKGVNPAGYAAWALGFVVGILNHPWVKALPGWHPAALYSFVVGFVVYLILAAVGLQPKKEEAYTVVEPPEQAS